MLSLSVWFYDRLIRCAVSPWGSTCLDKLSVEVEGSDVIWGSHLADGLQMADLRRGKAVGVGEDEAIRLSISHLSLYPRPGCLSRPDRQTLP